MGMGLKNASAFFQRMMEMLLQEFLWKTALAYQDDISCGSDSAKCHVMDLDAILSKFVGKGLKLKLSKCLIGKTTVETVGFKVSHRALVQSDKHVKSLAGWPEPKNGQELMRFLGAVQIFSRFVERCADRVVALYQVLLGSGWNKKKPRNIPFPILDFEEKWTVTQRESFLDLRAALSDPEMMVPPRAGAKKRVVTDASNVGYGAVLFQQETNEEWSPVEYIARKLKVGTPRYTTTEKEAGAYVWAIRKWRHHLDGHQFEAVTDHIALRWLMNLKLPLFRLANWVLDIQALDFVVLHAAGNCWLCRPTDQDSNVESKECLAFFRMLVF
jgi:RNase H-like domain found in reverse transcriptase/Reverse transcriptase (RNA-dependent DNA polymerase)